jgi:hypothetical protein
VYNHDQKARDMARSVLPSKRRQYARAAKRALRKRERSTVRASLRLDLIDPQIGIVHVDLRREIREVIWERRAGDKIGPITRWAERQVATQADLQEADLPERIEHFRSVLPSNKIGRHALGHIAWAVGARDVGREHR